LGIGDIGYQPNGIWAAARRQILDRIIENRLRSADDRDARPVVGKTACRSQSHAATAADDDRGGVREPQIHGAGPVRFRSSWAGASRR
jgi:hypothetical protein